MAAVTAVLAKNMKVNDKLTVTIDDQGIDGEGIAHSEGCVIFVPFALVGDTVEVKVVHCKGTLVYAELCRVVQKSPYRITPVCNQFGRCGGCDWLQAQYEYQLTCKRHNVAVTLSKAGVTAEVLPCVPSPDVLGYRNKIALPFGVVGGKVSVGFFCKGTHRVVSINRCPLHGEWATALIAVVLEWARDNRLTVYDSATGKGVLRHVVARKLEGHWAVTMVVNAQALPAAGDLAKRLQTVHDDWSLYCSPNTRRNNVILGDSVFLVAGKPRPIDMDGVQVEVNPLSFVQVNDGIRRQLYGAVRQVIGDTADSAVIDAFAGVGVLGASLAKNGAEVYNIEIVPQAVEDANRLVRQNGLQDRVHNLCGDSAVLLPKVLDKLANRRCVVVLDPPRKGCPPAVVECLTKPEQANRIATLVYISCNPATLARDLAALGQAYDIESVQPWDMFPQTANVETLCVLRQKG